ncbi:hypothetical protein Clacol_007655 [Clathrus columnatus]|uniref:Uncharacterized protein n=1 Tax=Clathrus columnatus TaxID=1419009 RepID=A0AAV5ALT5_9AGAM|nr:hypothetical protein Clacol_007655 [Clathrus columnatus]
MTKSINAAVPVVVDDSDDFCSCSESIYHSFIDPVVESTHLPHPSTELSDARCDLLSSSVDLMDPLTLKVQRSTECARQRLKKPMDIAKAKRPCSSCTYCRRYRVAKSTVRSPQANRVLRYDFHEAKADAKLQLERSRELADSTDSAYTPTTRASGTASLLDFVKPPSRSAANRFELINRPRQVLALDDFTEIDPDKYDLDDWEHVPAPMYKGKESRRSYARVVAAKA